ncbi:hypothetical protein ANACAC_03046 [Anaerostipes caccae L1-92]|uniref:Uncharacterized protein n=1 Tax=Anaerostipes caccae (strain DSM 14662 / CCUG 47493 / JCM 13470 / NCIMB 13811 / L1-92) TaxID=411490 RepID=B0MHT4_ANACD|nr:hypothetical protein ANACAC_03046 [Anaerostipes caccae L1-92]
MDILSAGAGCLEIKGATCDSFSDTKLIFIRQKCFKAERLRRYL